MQNLDTLVMCGGSYYIFAIMGMYKRGVDEGIIDLDRIKHIYLNSASSLFMVPLIMGADWDTIYTYYSKRPFTEVGNIAQENAVCAITKTGVFGTEIFEQTLEPLFSYADCDLNMTLAQLHQKSGKTVKFSCIEVGNFSQIKSISHITHPNTRVIEAIHATCAIPILIRPIFIDNTLYCDAGLINHYPLELAVEDGHPIDNIVGINLETPKTDITRSFNTMPNTFTLLTTIIQQMSYSAFNGRKERPKIKWELNAIRQRTEIHKFLDILVNMEQRTEYFNHGYNSITIPQNPATTETPS